MGIKLFRPSLRLIFLGAGTRRSKRLNPPGRPPTPARVTKRRGTILNDNTRKSQPVRNETPRRLVQYFLKIQLDVELAVNTLQKCHDTGAAQLKRLRWVMACLERTNMIIKTLRATVDGRRCRGRYGTGTRLWSSCCSRWTSNR
jgi:hypothetical protein